MQSANLAKRKHKPLKLVEDDTAYLSAQYHGLLVDIDEDTSDSSSYSKPKRHRSNLDSTAYMRSKPRNKSVHVHNQLILSEQAMKKKSALNLSYDFEGFKRQHKRPKSAIKAHQRRKN